MVSSRSFDLFRRLPRDLTYSTQFGGLLSVVVLIVISLLVLLETVTFLSGETSTDLVLDPNSEEELRIAFNVTLLRLPCEFVEVDAHDQLGRRHVNITRDVNRRRVSGKLGEVFLGDYARPHGAEAIRWSHPDQHHAGHVPEWFQVDVLSEETFDSTLQENHLSFVNFGTDWCHWCRDLAPIWRELAFRLQHTTSVPVRVYNVACTTNAEFCAGRMHVYGYPTLRMFHGNNALEPDFDGLRTVETMRAYVLRVVEETGEKAAPAPAEEARKDVVAAVRTHGAEGCNIGGVMYVQRVPGTLHIFAKSEEHDFDAAATNLSHIVHTLSFGEELKARRLSKLPFSARRALQPYTDKLGICEKEHYSHLYYVKLVSTFYTLDQWTFSGHNLLGYRISVSSQVYNSSPRVPELAFNYVLSPTAAVVTHNGRRWFEFLTNLCAIGGGVFVLSRGLESFVHRFTAAKPARRTADGFRRR